MIAMSSAPIRLTSRFVRLPSRAGPVNVASSRCGRPFARAVARRV
jgi:hypothetical protein